MKRNNNLIKISNIETGEVRYFTKDSYVQHYVACSQSAVTAIKTGKSRDYTYIKYEIVDGSNIKYKDINII